MSRIHDIPGGYVTGKGRHRERKMLTMTPEERAQLYQYVCDIQQLRDCLDIPDWNEHDRDVLPGIAANVGPIHHGGRNRDITTIQLYKFVRALLKLKAACKRSQMELPYCPVLVPTNEDADGHLQALTSTEVRAQMDVNRAADADQQYLRDNPDLIQDGLTPFKHIWPKYKK